MNETSKQKLPVIDALHEALEKNNRENVENDYSDSSPIRNS